MIRRLIALLLLWCPLPAIVATDEAALFTAVKAGDPEAVKALLQTGAPVGVLEEDAGASLSLLFLAVVRDDVAVARLLLQAGALDHPYAFLEGPTGTYQTALGDACSRSRFAIVDLMLEFGADTDPHSRAEDQRCLDWHAEIAVVNRDEARLQAWLGHIPADWTPHLALLLHYREAPLEIRALIERRFPGILDGSVNELNAILDLPDRGAVYRPHPNVRFPLATSFLDDARFPGRYAVGRAFDGDLTTSWVEGTDGPGIGERIAFLLPHDTGRIEVLAGYGEERYYLLNNRVKQATLRILLLRSGVTEIAWSYRFEAVHTMELSFENVFRFQSFPLDGVHLPASVGNGNPGPRDQLFAVLEITEVYPGTRWDDTCIAEIRFVR